ncbi:MAG: hypothetical protein ACFB02_04555 [Mastigocoleus sp.]
MIRLLLKESFGNMIPEEIMRHAIAQAEKSETPFGAVIDLRRFDIIKYNL